MGIWIKGSKGILTRDEIHFNRKDTRLVNLKERLRFNILTRAQS